MQELFRPLARPWHDSGQSTARMLLGACFVRCGVKGCWVHLQGASQEAVRNVALNSDAQSLSLLDMDGSADSSSPPALVRRTPNPRYDETPGEPIRPGRGVSRAAGIKPQGAAEQQTMNGAYPRQPR